jgi:DNA adenine methylase
MWAGGKSRLIKRYEPFLPRSFSTYIEPFFGGGAMFCWAKEQNPDASFIIGDINSHIIGIYQAIRDGLPEFLDRMESLSGQYMPLEKSKRKDFFYALRDENAYRFDKWSHAAQSATLYFLMKTAFNGIWQINHNTNDRFGTPAGLLNQRDSVFDREGVLAWHEALKGVEISCADFEQVGVPDDGTFLFMDPPYRGSFTQYDTDFTDDEQRRVVRHLLTAKANGASAYLSNRDCGDGFFERLCDGLRIERFPVTYTAGRRKKMQDGTYAAKKAIELLIF